MQQPPSPARAEPGKTRGQMAREILAVLAITGLCTLGLLEIALRLFLPQRSPEMRGELVAGLFAADPHAVYRNTPGVQVPFDFDEFHTSFAINSQGLREDQPIGPPAPGTTRLLAIGDSFTFGWGVPNAQTWPHLLTGSHAADGSPVEGVNGGVAGYGPDNEAAWLSAYGWPLAPKIVLVGFYVGNDVRDAMLGMDKTTLDAQGRLVPNAQTRKLMDLPDPQPVRGPLYPIKNWLATNSHAYVFLRALAHNLAGAVLPAPSQVHAPGLYDTAMFYYKAPPPDIAAGWQKTFGILDGIRADARAHGAQLLVVVIPTREQVEQSYWQDMERSFGLTDAQLVRDQPQRELAAWSARTGAPLIDLLPGFQAANGGPFYFRRDPHWNAAGDTLAATLIHADLVRRGWFR